METTPAMIAATQTLIASHKERIAQLVKDGDAPKTVARLTKCVASLEASLIGTYRAPEFADTLTLNAYVFAIIDDRPLSTIGTDGARRTLNFNPWSLLHVLTGEKIA